MQTLAHLFLSRLVWKRWLLAPCKHSRVFVHIEVVTYTDTINFQYLLFRYSLKRSEHQQINAWATFLYLIQDQN